MAPWKAGRPTPPRVAGKDVGGVGGGMGPPSLRQQDVNSNSQSSSSAPFFFFFFCCKNFSLVGVGIVFWENRAFSIHSCEGRD